MSIKLNTESQMRGEGIEDESLISFKICNCVKIAWGKDNREVLNLVKKV